MLSDADRRDMWQHMAWLMKHAYGDKPTDKAIELYHAAQEKAEQYSDLAENDESSELIRNLINEMKD